MFEPLIQRLEQYRQATLRAALDGLKGAAAGITLEMRDTTAHGDVTGATRANYTAYAVGLGESGGTQVGRAVAAVEHFNPGHVARSSTGIPGDVGVIITSFTDYQEKLETEGAGAKAVIGPTLQANTQRLTQAAANEMKRIR